MSYNETWLKTWCPACKAVNWICCGDMQDQTVPDIEAVKCHKCGEEWPLGEDPYYDVEDLDEDDEEEESIYTETGKPSPD